MNGGAAERLEDAGWKLMMPAGRRRYCNAQIDDYQGRARANFPWRPGTTMRVEARFSHDGGELVGTAGFGFWNAPFGPATRPWPALPQATWFFFASRPGDLPLAPEGEKGRGWFASTIAAATPRSYGWLALSPLLVILNQFAAVRRRLWPRVRRSLGISFQRLDGQALTQWRRYELLWEGHGCTFKVDGRRVLETGHRPRGPLGFVAWIDNQYLIATPSGRLRWGTLRVDRVQWLELANLHVQ